MDLRIYPPEEMIEASVSLPLSKSISNRAIIMHLLTPSAGKLPQVAVCVDTRVMVDALIAAKNAKGQPFEANVGLSGTAMRFLTAYFASRPGIDVVLDGNERMRQRPIGELVDALRQCGADISYTAQEGFPPLHIRGQRLHGGEVSMDATVSSQFVSALVMVAPTFDSPLHLRLTGGKISSLPYLDMTLAMMRQRGVNAERENMEVTVPQGPYVYNSDLRVERDWSAASYWYEIAAVSTGWITLEGLSLDSIQGDKAAAKIFERLGIVTEVNDDGSVEVSPSPEMFSRLDLDLSDYPDLAPALAVTACLLSVPFSFSGLKSLRIKECDRLDALCQELGKLSYKLEIEKDDILKWSGYRTNVRTVVPIDPHGDHRIAMAFAPAALFLPGLAIRNAEVVNKSYPSFWEDMQRVGFKFSRLQ